MKRQIFLDCDGVLADFDALAQQVFGMHPREYEEQFGGNRFWDELERHGSFYQDLPLMPDALKLFEGVRHLEPVILTGSPAVWADGQKYAWGARYFPETPMIVCKSRDKRLHMKPGDVLIDDFLKYRHLWEEAGGIFIHYQNAEQALRELEAILNADAEAGEASAEASPEASPDVRQPKRMASSI